MEQGAGPNDHTANDDASNQLAKTKCPVEEDDNADDSALFHIRQQPYISVQASHQIHAHKQYDSFLSRGESPHDKEKA